LSISTGQKISWGVAPGYINIAPLGLFGTLRSRDNQREIPALIQSKSLLGVNLTIIFVWLLALV